MEGKFYRFVGGERRIRRQDAQNGEIEQGKIYFFLSPSRLLYSIGEPLEGRLRRKGAFCDTMGCAGRQCWRVDLHIHSQKRADS